MRSMVRIVALSGNPVQGASLSADSLLTVDKNSVVAEACSLREPASQAGKTLLRLIVSGTPRLAIKDSARCQWPAQRFNRACRPAPTVRGSNSLHRRTVRPKRPMHLLG